MFQAFSQFSEAVNITTLLLGMVLGAALILAIQSILGFVVKNWRPIVILSVSTLAVSAAVIAYRGGI